MFEASLVYKEKNPVMWGGKWGRVKLGDAYIFVICNKGEWALTGQVIISVCGAGVQKKQSSDSSTHVE